MQRPPKRVIPSCGAASAAAARLIDLRHSLSKLQCDVLTFLATLDAQTLSLSALASAVRVHSGFTMSPDLGMFSARLPFEKDVQQQRRKALCVLYGCSFSSALSS